VNHLKYNVVFIILGLLSCLAFYDIDNKPEMEKSKLDCIAPQNRELLRQNQFI
jgi:hypothetical protein